MLGAVMRPSGAVGLAKRSFRDEHLGLIGVHTGSESGRVSSKQMPATSCAVEQSRQLNGTV